MTGPEIAKRIEHTLLKPEATVGQIEALCADAVKDSLFGVCVNPIHATRARAAIDRLTSASGSGPVLICVVGFPLGAQLVETQADEARRVMDLGSAEIDMVANLGAIIDNDAATVENGIRAVADAVHQQKGLLKVILETAALTDEQVILGCKCAKNAGADFVKTSTGFHASGGATTKHVRLLHKHAAPLRVKAAGGIRTIDDALRMIEAGASRIGTSSGPAIVAQAKDLP